MCGRAALTNETLEEIADALEAEPVVPAPAALYRPRYNIAPTDQVWIVVAREGRRRLIPATWGLPPPPGGARRPVINVRSESLRNQGGPRAKSPSGGAFASLFREGRCAFVCSGFYEWNAARQPFFFRPTDGPLLLLAGLASSRGPAELPAMTVLTTQPNELVASVHDRMPVVLPGRSLDDWLTEEPAEAVRRLVPAPPSALACARVSKWVGSVRHDDPQCLAPPTEAEREAEDEAASKPASKGERGRGPGQLKLLD